MALAGKSLLCFCQSHNCQTIHIVGLEMGFTSQFSNFSDIKSKHCNVHERDVMIAYCSCRSFEELADRLYGVMPLSLSVQTLCDWCSCNEEVVSIW